MNPQGQQVGDATHERKDVDVVGIFLVAALLIVLLTLSAAGVWGVIHFLNAQRQEHRPMPLASRSAGAFPQPRLEAVPGAALEKDVATQDVQLQSYGWNDRGKGTLHIPIDRAMQLLVERGLPEVGAGQTRLQLMQARPQTNVQQNQPVTGPAPSATP